MHKSLRINSILSISCMLLFLLAACGGDTSVAPTTGTPAPTLTPTLVAPTSRGIPSTSTTSTQPTQTMPPTQTSCPPIGMARAMTMVPLALGTHQTVVYTLNEGTYDMPTVGKLLRYDGTTGKTTAIVTLPHAHFYQAQVSTDGQWILFVSVNGATGRQAKLQMVRLDGQGLQTLACAQDYSIQQVQWSYDQNRVVFYNVVNKRGTVYILDMNNGTIQTALTTPPNVGLVIRTWLDANRIYITDTSIDTIHTSIYLLDLHKGMQQSLNNLTIVVRREYGDFDSSYDGSGLLISYGGCRQDICSGPSSIGVQPISGVAQHVIYSSQSYDVIQIRVVDQQSMIFLIGNSVSGGDTSQDGLWKIKSDGSGLTRLLPTTDTQVTYFNYRTQDLWSNISRDTSMYILQVNSFSGATPTNDLVLGALNGGATHVIASIKDDSQLAMVGWTVM